MFRITEGGLRDSFRAVQFGVHLGDVRLGLVLEVSPLFVSCRHLRQYRVNDCNTGLAFALRLGDQLPERRQVVPERANVRGFADVAVSDEG